MRILTFSAKGYELAKGIKNIFSDAKVFGMKRDLDDDGLLYTPSVKQVVKYGMYLSEPIIFVSSIGIATRFIKDFIRHKSVDSPIIVINDEGNYVIPILSGHLGKANTMAKLIADEIGGQAIITTATDHSDYLAVDMLADQLGRRISDFKKATLLTGRLLHHQAISIYPLGDYPKGYIGVDDKENADIIIGDVANEKALTLIKPKLILGIGCKKGYSPSLMKAFVEVTLSESRLDINDVVMLVSHERKVNEEAIRLLSNDLEVPYLTYTTDEMVTHEDCFEGSTFVKKTLGVGSVAEIAGYMGSNFGKCILPKVTNHGMTLSIWERISED